MTIKTMSKFFYGHIVDETNQSIDFGEGAAELQATLDIGDYSATEYLTEVERAMNLAGAQIYTATLDRITRLVNLSAPGNFELLVTTGTRIGTTAFPLLGYTGADLTGSNSYTGNNGTGSEYLPQRVLRNYLNPDYNNDAVEASINESGSGEIQVFSFGQKKMTEFIIEEITNLNQGPYSVVENNPTGIEDAVLFMENAILKAKIELMPDRNSPDSYFTIYLDKTKKNSKGVGYSLYKQFKDGVEGYYDTKILTWRVVE